MKKHFCAAIMSIVFGAAHAGYFEEMEVEPAFVFELGLNAKFYNKDYNYFLRNSGIGMKSSPMFKGAIGIDMPFALLDIDPIYWGVKLSFESGQCAYEYGENRTVYKPKNLQFQYMLNCPVFETKRNKTNGVVGLGVNCNRHFDKTDDKPYSSRRRTLGLVYEWKFVFNDFFQLALGCNQGLTNIARSAADGLPKVKEHSAYVSLAMRAGWTH